MITLGIEGTAHTIGIGIFDSNKDKIIADKRRVYQPERGIHPRESAQFIGDNFKKVLDLALKEGNLTFREIDLISFSQGPGMGPCLRTIATGARALSLHYKIPIIGVNHCVSHIEVGKYFCGFSDPLILYVSGGNTQVLKLKEGRYRIFGETLDIGIGNMLDKFGRIVNLSHPQGPKIEALAKKGKKYIELPYVVKGTDLSFSGLLTSVIGKLDKEKLEDICYSLQETAFSMLTEVTERALAHINAEEVLLTGGVGNNFRLQKMLKSMAKNQGARFGVPKNYCSDNGFMIAVTGSKMYEEGKVRMGLDDTLIKQGYRTDEVKISW